MKNLEHNNHRINTSEDEELTNEIVNLDFDSSHEDNNYLYEDNLIKSQKKDDNEDNKENCQNLRDSFRINNLNKDVSIQGDKNLNASLSDTDLNNENNEIKLETEDHSNASNQNQHKVNQIKECSKDKIVSIAKNNLSYNPNNNNITCDLNLELRHNMSHFDDSSKVDFAVNNDLKLNIVNNHTQKIEINNLGGRINIHSNPNHGEMNFTTDNLSPIKKIKSEEKPSAYDLDEYSGNTNILIEKKNDMLASVVKVKQKIIQQNYDYLKFNNDDKELIKTFNFAKNLKTFDKFLLNNKNKIPPILLTKQEDVKNKIITNTKTKNKNFNHFSTEIISKISSSQCLLNKNILKISLNSIDNTLKDKKKSKDEIIIKSLEEEIKTLKQQLNKLRQSKTELKLRKENHEEEITLMREKYEDLLTELNIQSNKLIEVNLNKEKIKYDNYNKENTIERINADLILKEELVNKYLDEAKMNKNQVDNLKIELNIQRGENKKKNEKISELQQINFSLEQELDDIKSRTLNEICGLKENRKNFDSLKSSHYEIKNQYELLNLKYQSISDENFNIKRDLLLYEKEIKNKNEMIERLRRELIDSSKRSIMSEVSGQSTSSNLNLNLNLNNIMKGGRDYDLNPVENNPYTDRDGIRENFVNNTVGNYESISGNKNLKKKNFHKDETYEKHLESFNKTGTQKNNNTFNREHNISKDKENERIREVENKMHDMNREREFVQAELNKIPQFPKKREQIIKKQELEDKIENYGRDLARIKIELKELNTVKRES